MSVFTPTKMTYTCPICEESINVEVPYCTLPVLPDDWRSITVLVDKVDGALSIGGFGNRMPVYCHKQHVSAVLRGMAEAMSL